MLKLKFLSFAALISIALFFVSCSDDKKSSNVLTPENANAKDYMPGKEGTWWNYQISETDSEGNILVSNETVTKKVTFKERRTVNGVNAYIYEEVENFFGDVYESEEIYDIHEKTIHLLTEFDFEDVQNEEWVKILDLIQNNWDDFEQNIGTTDFLGFEFRNTKVTFSFSRGMDSTISLKGKNYETVTFEQQIKITAITSIPQVPLPVPIEINTTQIVTYALGVGKVKSEQKPVEILAFGSPLSELIELDEEEFFEGGEIQELIDFEIVK